MKTLIALLVMVVNSFSIHAHPDYPTPEASLRQEIKTLVGSPSLDLIPEGTTAIIVFRLNQDNEIIVLKIVTDNKTFDRYIKTKLNYKNVETVMEHDEALIFKIPVRVTS